MFPLDIPPIPTVTFSLRPDCDYKNIPRIIKIAPFFSITETGISRPKIIDLESSDGQRHRQLLKHGDDARQDAVMQQVFQFVNHILGSLLYLLIITNSENLS
jgi:ataxia telangiectasia mutated family protein